jgi:hypothetical protein
MIEARSHQFFNSKGRVMANANKTKETKETKEAKQKVNVKDVAQASESDAKDATLFVVEFTSIQLPGGLASNGDFVTADDLGDMKDLHLERGAIRAANLDEQNKYEAATAK